MTIAQKEQIKHEIAQAISKVMQKQDSIGFLITESTYALMATSAIHVLEVTQDANDSWERDGYLEV